MLLETRTMFFSIHVRASPSGVLARVRTEDSEVVTYMRSPNKPCGVCV